MTISEECERQLQILEKSRQHQLGLMLKSMKADGGNFGVFDLLVQGMVHRSLSLIKGFCGMIRDENLLCAAPLIRLQLDTFLRVYASNFYPKMEDFCVEVLKGARVSKLRDKKGRFLTDAYLVDKASDQFPWIRNVYKETSGFIHFSEKHIYSSITSYKDGTFEAAITGGDIGVTEELRREAIDAMASATKLVIELLQNWVDIKIRREEFFQS